MDLTRLPKPPHIQKEQKLWDILTGAKKDELDRCGTLDGVAIATWRKGVEWDSTEHPLFLFREVLDKTGVVLLFGDGQRRGILIGRKHTASVHSWERLRSMPGLTARWWPTNGELAHIGSRHDRLPHIKEETPVKPPPTIGKQVQSKWL